MAATAITIMGGSGQDTINFAFTVTGTNTTLAAQNFATAVNAILMNNPTSPLAGTSSSPGTLPPPDGGATPVYVLEAPVDGDNNYSIGASAYAVDSLSAAVNISLAGADSIIVGGINAAATVTSGSGSGSNDVIFITGQNEFLGTNDSGGDTIVAGSGRDTIYTSTVGSSTVYSGTGDASIYLQDTDTAGSFNDTVYLQDGSNTVFANGYSDLVFATSGGQTIDGDSTAGASQLLGIVIAPNSDGTPNGNDIVNASNTGTVAVYDTGSSNNTIFGGTGILYFIGGPDVSASLNIGTGNTYAYGASGDSITMNTQAGDTGFGYFVAGAGNETLNGAGATSNLYLFAGPTSSGGAAPSDSFTGGSALNLFTAGAGSDTFVGGTGSNYFQIDSSASAGANILIKDFATDGSVTGTLILDNFSDTTTSYLYSDTTTDSSGNLVAVIGNSTTITFTGISSGSQLQGHIITFN